MDELLDGRVVISGALPGRSWQEGLERVAAAVERELAGGLGPASLGGGHHCGQAAGYAEHSIAEYAEAVGVHPETLKNYRTVARAYRQSHDVVTFRSGCTRRSPLTPGGWSWWPVTR